MTTARYSDDTTLLAAGFSESYVKLWDLKGDSFEVLRSDGSRVTGADCRPFLVSTFPRPPPDADSHDEQPAR